MKLQLFSGFTLSLICCDEGNPMPRRSLERDGCGNMQCIKSSKYRSLNEFFSLRQN